MSSADLILCVHGCGEKLAAAEVDSYETYYLSFFTLNYAHNQCVCGKDDDPTRHRSWVFLAGRCVGLVHTVCAGDLVLKARSACVLELFRSLLKQQTKVPEPFGGSGVRGDGIGGSSLAKVS